MEKICQTTYVFIGDKNELEELYKNINQVLNPSPEVKNNFGTENIKCLLHNYGIDYREINCNGHIGDCLKFEKELNLLHVETMTQWEHCNSAFDEIIKKHPNITYFYISEEDKWSFYETNDADSSIFGIKYVVLARENDEETMYYGVDEEADFIQHINESNKTNYSNVNEILNSSIIKETIIYYETVNPIHTKKIETISKKIQYYVKEEKIYNPLITDKLTGESTILDTNGIDLRDFKPSQLNDLLSGKNIDHFDSAGNFLGKLGLSKTPAGWGLSIGKQVVSLADSEAGI